MWQRLPNSNIELIYFWILQYASPQVAQVAQVFPTNFFSSFSAEGIQRNWCSLENNRFQRRRGKLQKNTLKLYSVLLNNTSTSVLQKGWNIILLVNFFLVWLVPGEIWKQFSSLDLLLTVKKSYMGSWATDDIANH